MIKRIVKMKFKREKIEEFKKIFFESKAITLSLVACGFGTNQEPTLAPPQVSIETPFPNGDPTPLPTYTPTMAALGSPDNPITIGIINPTPETEQTDGLAQLASQLTGKNQEAFF